MLPTSSRSLTNSVVDNTEEEDMTTKVRDAEGCDPSYPDFCIPPYPPDLDCADVTGKCFTVLGPDPHGFDGDNDGIGCES